MPSLSIYAEDYAYIRAACSEAGFREIGGLGIITEEDGVNIVKHMRLLEQTVSSSEVDWGDLGEAHAEYLTWLYTPVEEDGAGFDGDSYGIYSWHSHGNMSVFWSGTDENFIKGVGTSVPYVFSSVYNNKGESKHRLDVFPKTNSLGCELLSPGDIKQQITWQNNIDLWIVQPEYVNPVMDELEGIEVQEITDLSELEKEFEAKKKEIEEKAKELKKPLQEELTTRTKEIQAVAKELMKVDYKKYVTTKHYYSSGPKGQGSTTPNTPSQKAITAGKNSSNGSNTAQAGSKPGKGDGGADDGEKIELTDEHRKALRRNFKTYHTVRKQHGFRSIDEIVLDENVVLCEDLPVELWEAVPMEIAMTLAERETYDEYIERMRGLANSYGIGGVGFH